MKPVTQKRNDVTDLSFNFFSYFLKSSKRMLPENGRLVQFSFEKRSRQVKTIDNKAIWESVTILDSYSLLIGHDHQRVDRLFNQDRDSCPSGLVAACVRSTRASSTAASLSWTHSPISDDEASALDSTEYYLTTFHWDLILWWMTSLCFSYVIFDLWRSAWWARMTLFCCDDLNEWRSSWDQRWLGLFSSSQDDWSEFVQSYCW